jgi:hypothetical protein
MNPIPYKFIPGGNFSLPKQWLELGAPVLPAKSRRLVQYLIH